MVGVALLGAGIFAKEQHLPAIEAAEDLDLLAVYSRSQASAEALAATATSKPPAYFDSPSNVPGKSLDDLLARKDIEAVIIGVPILAQPDVIRKALAAGKHVLSEKPIAPDVKTAKSLIDYYNSLDKSTRPVWAVAENFRFLPSLQAAAAKVKGLGGRLVSFHLIMNGFVSESDQFYNTEWRKTPGYQGGFLLDGGVHFLAALRFLLDAAGDSVDKVACFSSLLESRLPPVDSVHAVASTRANKVNGTVSISFGTEHKSTLEVCVVTTTGRVTFDPGNVVVKSGSADETKESFEQNFGVIGEVAAFAKSIAAAPGAQVNPLQSPEEAFQDLAFLEALLASGAASGAVKTVAAA